MRQLYDSNLFEEGDDKNIHECFQYWGIFIGKLIKDEIFSDRQDFIDKASKLARQHYASYEEHGWVGLISETQPTKRSEEEEDHGEEEENDDWFEFINTDFFLKFNFMLEFVASSAFQFELFKTIFKSPNIIKDVQHELPYTVLLPKLIYVEETSFVKLDNVIGPAYDFTPIENTTDIILPLSMSSDVNEDFWMEMMDESFQMNSDLSFQQLGG